MVIKDLLNKASKPADPNSPEVKALREKLERLKQKSQPAAPQPAGQSPDPQTPQQAPPEKPRSEDELQRLAQASEAEQRRFVHEQDPSFKVREERTHKLVAKQIGEMIELNTELNKRLTKLEQEKTSQERKLEAVEQRNEELKKKMEVIDQRLEKFMGLYEVITNQFNPFAGQGEAAPRMPSLDEPAPTEPAPEDSAPEEPAQPDVPKAKLQVSDGLTGEARDVEVEQGRMSSENARKMEQLLAELERDEREKRDASEEEVAGIEVREKERGKEVIEEMHALFAGFEGRLQQYLDASVQEKLHATFSNLESVLNEEIEQAVKDEVGKLKDGEDVISAALKEIEELSSQASDPEAFSEAEQAIEAEVRAVDDQIKAIPPNLYFRLHDGRVLKSKDDLVAALEAMDVPTFSHHVTEQHNDFADWLELALEDPQGQELRGKSREEMLDTLRES